MRSENLAIMFTDMLGFTARTSEQTRHENELLLALHDSLLLPVIRTFNGNKIKSIGDAFLVTFRSPTDSVLCGMAIQDRLWDYNRDVAKNLRIDVRVAINLGEVRLAKGDVFGEPVNIAARVEAIAKPGEIYLTESVYLAMNRREAPAVEIGQQTLKGIPEPVRIFRVPYASGSSTGDITGTVTAYPYGGRELARVRETGAKLTRAKELAVSLGKTLDQGGARLVAAKTSLRTLRGDYWDRTSFWIGRRLSRLSPLLKPYRSLEDRVGTITAMGLNIALITACIVGGYWLRESMRYDPYAESRALISEGAYPTALARLDALGRQANRLSDARYWYLRGQALMKTGAVDQAMDAYREALTRDIGFRRSVIIADDAASAVGVKHNTKAQKLILNELGPEAEPSLLAEARKPEAVYRWTLVELVEKLGGRNRVPYFAITLVDLTTADSCAKKKKAIQKMGELQDIAALPTLEALPNDPDYRCLQATIATAFEQIRLGIKNQ